MVSAALADRSDQGAAAAGSGGAGPGLGPEGPTPHVREDRPDDRGIVQGGGQAQAVPTGWTRQHVDAERHQVLAGATLTLKPRHAGLEHAAQQELPGLPLDELRQARPAAGLRHRLQEGLQVERDDLVEHGVLGILRAIHGRDTSHTSG